MRFHHGSIHWYDIILFALAAAIVYPDRILDWLSARTGRTVGWLHLVLIEIAAVTSLIVAMVFLMPIYPKLEWWHPILYVGMLGTMRVTMCFITAFFGFDD